MSKYGDFFGPYIPVFRMNVPPSVFIPHMGKYGPEKLSYSNTFDSVLKYKTLLKVVIKTSQQSTMSSALVIFY